MSLRDRDRRGGAAIRRVGDQAPLPLLADLDIVATLPRPIPEGLDRDDLDGVEALADLVLVQRPEDARIAARVRIEAVLGVVGTDPGRADPDGLVRRVARPDDQAGDGPAGPVRDAPILDRDALDLDLVEAAHLD